MANKSRRRNQPQPLKLTGRDPCYQEIRQWPALMLVTKSGAGMFRAFGAGNSLDYGFGEASVCVQPSGSTVLSLGPPWGLQTASAELPQARPAAAMPSPFLEERRRVSMTTPPNALTDLRGLLWLSNATFTMPKRNIHMYIYRPAAGSA